MRKSLIALALAGSGLTTISAQAAAPDFQTRAEAYLKAAYPGDGPGAAAIVMDDGKVIYSGARGLARLETGTPITPDTVFRLGSITKQFTAAVILQLAEEGRLSLSDPLSKHLPDHPKPGADATIVQLLNHTSGIKSYTGIPALMSDDTRIARAFTTDELIAAFKGEPGDFPVGTQHRYNNSGYVLLGAIIERITGKPWHVAVDERIAKPLGLATLRYGTFEPVIPNMAAGYAQQEGKPVPAQAMHMSFPHAAGALVASVGDLAKWADALHKGKVVRSASYARMIAPSKLPDGSTLDYAFGLNNTKLRGQPALAHGGGIPGFDTASIYVPGDDVFVAVFANSADPAVDPDVVMIQLAALAVGDPVPSLPRVDIALPQVEPLFGVYKVEGGERHFFARDGRLFTRRTGGSEQEVFAAGQGRFSYGPAALTWFEVRRDPAGKHEMLLYAGGAKEPSLAVRTGPVPPAAPEAKVSRDVLQGHVGTYKAALGLAKVAVGADGRLTLQLGPQRPVALLATSASEFRGEMVDARIVFHGNGAAKYLVIHQGSNQIRADRVTEGN